MRKYRGKRVDTGEWVYGSLLFVPYTGMTYMFPDAARIVKLSEIIPVDPKTVGQYTGLQDKNGKEIYEGDIIDGSWINPMSQEKVERHFKVAFDKGKYNAELIGHHPYGSTLLYFESEKGEVIGNIFENPELLEV